MKVVRLKGSTHILAFISSLNFIREEYFVCFCRVQVGVLKLRHIFYMIYWPHLRKDLTFNYDDESCIWLYLLTPRNVIWRV